MANLITLFNTLHSGRKGYTTAAALILVGVGILTGQVDSGTVSLRVGEVTFENVDERLSEAQAPAPASNNDGLIGLIALLLGANSAANRAAIGKLSNGTATQRPE